jgi:hypothetical protein
VTQDAHAETPETPETPERYTDATTGVDTSTFAEGHLARVLRLERQLGNNRKWSRKATRQLHGTMLKEIQAAERRARQAERRAEAAEKRLAKAQGRARAAEAEVAALHDSATWKAGRAVVAVPAKLKQRWGPR